MDLLHYKHMPNRGLDGGLPEGGIPRMNGKPRMI
jgi:hypothetical protein